MQAVIDTKSDSAGRRGTSLWEVPTATYDPITADENSNRSLRKVRARSTAIIGIIIQCLPIVVGEGLAHEITDR